MRRIDIDEEVYQALLKLVKSFEDTPNDVLRNLLGLDEADEAQRETEMVTKTEEDYTRPVEKMASSLGMEEALKPKITRVRGATPRKEYQIPILEALLEMEGKGTPGEVFEIIEEKMKERFNNLDLEILECGDIRWQKAAAWQRYFMVREGLLSPNSPRGIWEITELGREYLRRVKDNS